MANKKFSDLDTAGALTGAELFAVSQSGVSKKSLLSAIKTFLDSATATLTNKTLTSPVINSPTGIVKGDVGLGNVDNTSDVTKNSASVTLTNKTLISPVISSITNTGTLTLPTSTDTLVGKATTDTLTNKTFDSAGTGNVLRVNGVGLTAVSGTGAVVLATGDASSLTGLTSTQVTTALGYKPPLVLAQSGVASAVTGTTSPTTLATISVPANSLGANGALRIDFSASFTASTNLKTISCQLNGSTVASFGRSGATETGVRSLAVVQNRGVTNSQVISEPSSTSVVFGVFTATFPATLSIDTTASTSITFVGTLANSSETITLERYLIEIVKP